MKSKSISIIERLVAYLTSGLMMALPLTACSEKVMNLDVSVYNYWPRAINDVAVNGQYAGGAFTAYHPGGAGGSAVCCVKVKPGSITIEYTLGGPAGASRLGEKVHATAVLKEIPSDAKVLTVHVYPNGTISAEATAEFVDERPQPGAQ